MSKEKYLVVHPRYNLNVKLEGDDKAKVQRVPRGTELSLEKAHAKSGIASGKLVLATAAKKATAGESSEGDEDKDAVDNLLKDAEAKLKEADDRIAAAAKAEKALDAKVKAAEKAAAAKAEKALDAKVKAAEKAAAAKAEK